MKSKLVSAGHLGRTAEAFVAETLLARGWTLLARNFRHCGFELDIVASKGGTLVIVEVKARRWALLLETEYAALLTPAKAAALTRGAQFFVMTHGCTPSTIRFDLAVVSLHRNGLPRACHYWVDVIAT